MTDTSEPKRDYRDTVFLPKTDFPMKAGLAAKEPAILERWAKIGVYDRLREQRAGRKRYILHDGPPYANGDIHMGHAMNKVLKDIIVRSRTLMGHDAPYIPGWDCHGLPIEWKVEEAYRAKKLNKDDVPVAQFRAECRAYAEKWVAVQRAEFERLGVMGDWADPYLTMKYEAEATIVGELLKFAESGQLYRGAKPVMWSPVEKTALAEAEVEYEDVVSTQIDVAFEILEAPNAPELLVGAKKVEAVIWTTTPWTIPVNQALAFGADFDYAIFRVSAVHVIEQTDDLEVDTANNPLDRELGRRFLLYPGKLAEDFLARYRRSLANEFGVNETETVSLRFDGIVRGASLAGATARHPMHQLGGFFDKPRPFLPGDFVTTDAGTGLVHMAPDHGEDDFLLCKGHGIDPVFAVDGAGMFREDWAWLGGQGSVINKKFVGAGRGGDVKEEGPICADLRAAGALLAASDDFKHSYPHSWRSKAKVIFRATPQWFIPMDAPSSSPSPSGEGLGVGPVSLTETDVPVDRPHPNPSPEGEGLLRVAPFNDLTGFDALVVSPGVPLNTHPLAATARAAGVQIIGDIELFAQARAELPPHKVVGITGTNGKSTTTALVHHILQTSGIPSLMGGNIGLPILAQEPLPEGGVYVLELSSYQIDLTQTLDCDVAVLLNITPDHLDRYDDGFEGYAASKARLFAMQSAEHAAVVGIGDAASAQIARSLSARGEHLTKIAPGVCMDQSRWPSLQGPHNAQNALAAIAACQALGVAEADIDRGLETFAGLPHRMERIGEIAGVTYIDDSKATNPESTAPALAAFDRVHWIVGGRAKGDDLEACRPAFGHVVRAYTIGEAGPVFAAWLKPHVSVAECGLLEVAVNAAAIAARSGETVLLSPAAASFDQFRDYAHRGDVFRKAVEALA